MDKSHAFLVGLIVVPLIIGIFSRSARWPRCDRRNAAPQASRRWRTKRLCGDERSALE